MRKIHGGREASTSLFQLYEWDFAGADDDFDTDQVETDTPTLTLSGIKPFNFQQGIIKNIKYFLTYDNAETYQLILYSRAFGDDITSRYYQIIQLPALQAKDQLYDRPYDKPIYLFQAGLVYYKVLASGALGNSKGWILIEGVVT